MEKRERWKQEGFVAPAEWVAAPMELLKKEPAFSLCEIIEPAARELLGKSREVTMC